MLSSTSGYLLRLLLVAGTTVTSATGCAELFEELQPSSTVALAMEPPIERGVASVHPRVEEDGFYVPLKLDLEGYKGRHVPIQLWSNTNVLLGEEIAVPTYDASTWKAFRVFVPTSRLTTVPASFNITAYVLSPDNSRIFVQKSTFPLQYQHGHQTWEALSYVEDATLPSGQRGFQLNAQLTVVGHKHERLQIVLVLRDWAKREFKPHEGGPIRVPDKFLRPRYDDTVWDELTLNVPYSALDRVGLGRTVILTPALRFPDGSLQLGNIHVRFYTGGSLTSLRERISEEAKRIEQRIRYIENQLEVIKKEAAR